MIYILFQWNWQYILLEMKDLENVDIYFFKYWKSGKSVFSTS